MINTMNEKFSSQLRAVILLAKMGWEPISRAQINELRHNKRAVILESILRKSLTRLNKIEYKEKFYDFDSVSIENAIFNLTNQQDNGPVNTNRAVFEILLRGVTVKQTIEGDTRGYNMKFIDFANPKNNVYNVAWEVDFETVSSPSRSNVRLDIVLYINGIPIAEIENKDGSRDVREACEQLCGYQQLDTIPYFYHFMQVMIATNRHHFLYGTVGTSKKHYAIWREKIFADKDVLQAWKETLSNDEIGKIFDEFFKECEANSGDFLTGNVLIQEQDRGIYSFFNTERLLDLIKNFTIFDGTVKKVARYQQFFAVKNILNRVSDITKKSKREGGIVWHTQGSGKSLTMVMTASMILNNKSIKEPKIIIVTDRTDLDTQILSTFKNCGFDEDESAQATSGTHLIKLIEGNKFRVITTLVQKFSNTITDKSYINQSHNIFILIDESHRTQNGINHFKMKKTFPNACYIGFTGTPLMKEDKNTIIQFGGLIDKYTIDQAIEDGAVVRLFYEGRHAVQEVDKNAIDTWFERMCKNLNKEEKADLKKKFAKSGELQKTELTIKCIAYDIAEHFREKWKGTGFKAQLVAPSKYSAILYKKYFDEIGTVKTEVVISPPDSREGYSETNENVFDDAKSEVQRFWNNKMNEYGNEKKYNDGVISNFKNNTDGDNNIEILIVVDKLLTGFDAPKNRTLYITRNLEGHTLLQAIARVNRTYEGKEEGYIVDYANILENLDKAITQYSSFSDYDEEDLKGVLYSVREEIMKLPKISQDLKNFFPNLDINKNKEEDFENFLVDEEVRVGENGFYKKVSKFSKVLSIASSNEEFNKNTDEKIIQQYKQELRFFWKLRENIKQKYAESDKIKYKDYELKIRELLNKHVSANDVLQVINDVNIFNEEELSTALKDKNSDRSKADLILNNTKKSIEVDLKEKDPILYKKFSKMIEDILEEIKLKKLSDVDYLLKAKELKDVVVNRKDDSIPQEIATETQIHPFYRMLETDFEDKDTLINIARFVYKVISNSIIVDWKTNIELQKNIKNSIDDYLWDNNITKNQDLINQICHDILELAKYNFK